MRAECLLSDCVLAHIPRALSWEEQGTSSFPKSSTTQVLCRTGLEYLGPLHSRVLTSATARAKAPGSRASPQGREFMNKESKPTTQVTRALFPESPIVKPLWGLPSLSQPASEVLFSIKAYGKEQDCMKGQIYNVQRLHPPRMSK